MLDVSNLCFSYGRQQILSHVSFSLAAGVLLASVVQQQSLLGGLMYAGGIVLLLLLLALCQVMPLVYLRSFIVKRLAYEHALLFCAFCLILVLYLTHSWLLLLLTGTILVAGCAVLLYKSG